MTSDSSRNFLPAHGTTDMPFNICMTGVGRLSSFGKSNECQGWTKSSASDVYLPIDIRERSPAVNARTFLSSANQQPSFLLTAALIVEANQYLNNDKNAA